MQLIIQLRRTRDFPPPFSPLEPARPSAPPAPSPVRRACIFTCKQSATAARGLLTYRSRHYQDGCARLLRPAYPIHLYGLSLINSFLTRLPTLVSSLSHDKTSLTSSATFPRASRDSCPAIAEIEVIPSEPTQPGNPLHNQRHAPR